MTSTPRTTVLRTAVLAIVVLALAGCAGPAKPTPAPTRTTASATPTPSPTATASGPRVEIDGTGITVYGASGASTVDLTFSVDAQTAAARLSTALKEQAATTTVTDDRCYPQLDESSWGGLHIWSTTDGLTRPAGAQFYVTADAAKTGTGVPILIPSGQSVGATKSQLLAANASAPSFADGDAIDVHYDIVSGSASGDPDQYYGAVAKIIGNRLTLIDSPIYYSRPC